MLMQSKIVRGVVFVAALALAGTVLSACTTGTGISGKVTANGVARAGLAVSVYPSGDPGPVIRTVATDAAGNYQINDLAPGTYHVRIASTAWYDGSAHAVLAGSPSDVVVNSGAMTTVSTDVPLAFGNLTGTVNDPSSNPVIGATVAAVSTEDYGTALATTTTGPGGTYTFAPGLLPAGTYVVRASAPGFGTVWAPNAINPLDATAATVTDGGTTTADAAFVGPNTSLAITVTNGSSTIPGSAVSVYTSGNRLVRTATTKADGTFTFTDLNQSTYHVLVTAPAPYLPGALGTYSDPSVAHSDLVDLTTGNAAVTAHESVCDANTYGDVTQMTRGWNFTGVNLQGCDLTNADLRSDTLTGANIDGTIMAGAKLRGVRSGHLTGTPASLPVGWRTQYGHLIGPGADLMNINASGLDMTGFNAENEDFQGVILEGASLRGIDFAGSNFSGADLVGVDLTGANLTGANLTGANLMSAKLNDADLTRAILTSSALDGADLTGATLNGVQSGGITAYTPPTLSPNAHFIYGGWLIAPGVDLSSGDLTLADLTDMDLTGANLSGTILYYANLTDTNLTGANLQGADVHGATMEGTDLTNADLTGLLFVDGGIFEPRPGIGNVVWSNTTCPNGTNSSASSPETCLGPGGM